MNEIFYHKTCLTMACIKQHPHHHFTSSLEIRYRKVKLWGIHSIMLFRDFPAFWHFLTLFLKDSGNDFWIISKTPPGHKSELFANDSIIFGRRILWSLRTPKVARTYSSFAASSSWNNLLGVYTRTWKIWKCKYSSSEGNEFLFSSQKYAFLCLVHTKACLLSLFSFFFFFFYSMVWIKPQMIFAF